MKNTFNNDQIEKRYRELKKLPVFRLKEIFTTYHRVSDTDGSYKIGLISDILIAEFGNKIFD